MIDPAALRKAGMERPIRFARIAPVGSGAIDGRAIYDRMLIRALQDAGAAVTVCDYAIKRGLQLPLWAPEALATDSERETLAVNDAWQIVSHEALFGSLIRTSVDAAIVHNYFPRFHYPGARLMNRYYTLGTKSYFRRAFASARIIVFVSKQDLDAAVAGDPSIVSRAFYLPPPPRPMPIGKRRLDQIHVSGTCGWWPKRRSRMSEADLAAGTSRGYSFVDFEGTAEPSFAFVSERFSVGFKLKVMQMVYAHDVIASLTDLASEIEAFAPGYPYYRTVASFNDALNWFEVIRTEQGAATVDAAFARTRIRAALPSWHSSAAALVSLLGTVGVSESEMSGPRHCRTG